METKKTWFQQNKGIAIFISVLVVIIIVLFAWSQIERRNLNKRMDEQRAEIIVNSRKLIDENRKNLLYDVSRSLSWAMRSEASRNNLDQANQYLNEFVRAREFELALFTDNDGNIVLATDKRMEGTLVQDQFEINIADVQDVNIQVMSDNKWIATAPVMGLNTRLGTLILIYDPRLIPDDDF
jgi:C4-dicarboxylate-specific signal transduction histidine kinase